MGPLSLPRRLSVLGCTGSVGVSTLDLIEKSGAEVEIIALTAGRNVERLAQQARQWRPRLAVIEDETKLPELRDRLAGTGIATAAGAHAVVEAAAMDAQWVMSAIVGFAGLGPTLAAARAGAVIGLANKESLVCAGPQLLRIAKLAGGVIIPVDSEHSAIFQVLDPLNAQFVARLILTSSGGPFRAWTREEMAHATPEQAVAHPNFSMGAKISVDSATMMNKGLEIIEAAYLFSMPPERVDVLIHHQQIIHSLVEYVDGSTLAQLGPPDMRPPIALAFAWPERLPWPAPRLDLTKGPLTFENPDGDRFPALQIAKAALAAGGAAPAVMNAANEVAVAAFLDRRIGFLDIAAIVADTLERVEVQGLAGEPNSDVLEGAKATDAMARRVACDVVAGLRPAS
ncbi:1-deoxy-D-xylulose-5-phosphate reductoisomerase [Phenylobacterium sp. 20VBR1]|uniref:1-deoxy-D-xylulose 5-phosphate reductoisomerase n=1 Tax=Phenylobacterium glaciei TaxID=2803784 RepID=A0A941D0B1_9CAUL|nr:1-deoxy-D-xylulose-5-phosphate reductoisomerase [Phenylobacterium glaciei]MBR7619881.1 1-deoxy-D-xylulose-5-phosphate reductoisomerase [Phenylobacterium glaciei]